MNPDVFVGLASLAWADGKLDPERRDAIVRAAAEEGLSLEDIARVEDSIAEKSSKSSTSRLSRADSAAMRLRKRCSDAPSHVMSGAIRLEA